MTICMVFALPNQGICLCLFSFTSPHEHSKLEPRSRLYCFLGYGIEQKGYRCWDPISKRLRISHHVIFWEYKMFSSNSKFHISPSSPFFIDSTIYSFPCDLNWLMSSRQSLLSQTLPHLIQILPPPINSQPRVLLMIRSPLAIMSLKFPHPNLLTNILISLIG